MKKRDNVLMLALSLLIPVRFNYFELKASIYIKVLRLKI
jgi:hypothetical protein